MFEYVGRALLHGQALYRDVSDNKLPGVYYLNALWQLLFGEAYKAHAFVEALIAGLSTGLLALVIRNFGLRLWLPASAALMVLLCVAFPLNTTEAYALPLLLGAILAARRSSPIFAAVLVSVACLLWVPSIVMVIPICAIVLRPAWWQVVGSAFAVLIMFSFGLFRAVGSATLITLVQSWLSYVAMPLPSHAHHPVLSAVLAAGTRFYQGTVSAAILPLCILLAATMRRPFSEAQRFGLIWTLSMVLAACIGMRFIGHYYIPALAAVLFTLAAFGFSHVLQPPRLVVVVLAAILFAQTSVMVTAAWAVTHDRSLHVARIGAATAPIVRGRLTLGVDSYQPGLYLALSPKLRNPYEIAAAANPEFAKRLPQQTSLPDVHIYTAPADFKSDAGVCTLTAAPWRIYVVGRLASLFSACP